MGFNPTHLGEWRSFIRSSGHILKNYPSLLFQQAANEPPESPVSRAALMRAKNGLEPRPWLRWINKPDARTGALMTLGEFGRGRAPSFAFSPDGSKIAVGGENSLALWAVAAGNPIATVDGLGGEAQFSPDGSCLLVFSGNRIHICDAATGALIATTAGRPLGKWRTSKPECFFSSDGALFICESAADTLAIINTTTGELVDSCSGPRDWLRGCILSPDRRRALCASDYHALGCHKLVLWDLETGKAGAIISGHELHITDYSFSPDGALIASASFDKTVRIWCASDGNLSSIFRGHREPVERCLFSPDGRHLLSFSSSPKPELKLWNLASGEEKTSFSGFSGCVYDCAFSPDSKRLATAGGWESSDNPEHSFGQLLIWDLDLGVLQTSFRGHTNEVRCSAFSPDGAFLASASSDGTVRLWDAIARPGCFGFSEFMGMPVFSAISLDGTQAGFAFPDRVEVWDTTSGKRSAIFTLRAGYLGGCGFSPGGERIAAVSSEGTATIWRLRDKKEVAVLRVKRWLTSCSFSSDGLHVFLGDGAGQISEWNPERGKITPIFDLGYASGGVERFTLSAGDTMLASVHRDGSLRLWSRAEKAEPVYLHSGDPAAGEAICCAISPDGRILLAGYDDGFIRLWDIAGLVELAKLKAHEEVVRACAFSPNGSWFATGSVNGHLKIWNLESLRVSMNYWHDGYPLVFAWLEDKKVLIVAHSAGVSRLEIQNFM